MRFLSFAGTTFDSLNVSAGLSNDTPDRDRRPTVFDRSGLPGKITGMSGGVRTIPVYFMVQPGNDTEQTILALIAALDPDNETPRALVGELNDGTTEVQVDAWVGSYIARPDDRKGLLVTFYTDDDRWRALETTKIGPYTFVGESQQTPTVVGQGRVKPLLKLGWAVQRGSSTSQVGWTYRRRITITNNSSRALWNHPFQLGPLNSGVQVAAGQMQSDGDDFCVFDDKGVRLRRKVAGTNRKGTFLWWVIDELAAGASRVYDICYGNASATTNDSVNGWPYTFPGSPVIDTSAIDGLATAGSASTMSTGVTVDPSRFVGSTILLTSAATNISGQYRRIASHTTAGVYTVARNFTSNPTAGATGYVIIGCGFMGDGGQASATSSSSLTDSSQVWNSNEWIGATVEIITLDQTGGTIINTATVTANSGTVLTVSGWESGTPSSTALYRVYSKNASWIYRTVQDSRTDTTHRGRWRLRSGQTQPSQVWFRSDGAPASWALTTYNPGDASYDHNQPRWTAIDVGGGNMDFFAILNAKVVRKDGPKLREKGYANGCELYVPVGVLGIRENFYLTNPDGMARAVMGVRERGGEDWNLYREDAATLASSTLRSTTYTDLTAYGTPVHLLAALTSDDDADIEKTQTGTAQMKDGGILEVRVDPRWLSWTDFDTATEDIVYDYTLTVWRGDEDEVAGDDLVVIGGDEDRQHVFLEATERIWVGPYGDRPLVAQIRSDLHTTLGAIATFDDADGTALEAAAGLAWNKHPTASASAVTINNNRIHNQNSATQRTYYHDWVPDDADYDVQASHYQASDNNTSKAGVMGRMDVTADTGYVVYYNANGDDWILAKRIAGVETQLATYNQDLTDASSHTGRLSMRGSAIRMIINGILRATVADTSITAAGRAGVYFADEATSSVGIHLDNFRALQGGDNAFVREIPNQVQVLTIKNDYQDEPDRYVGSEVLPLTPGSQTIRWEDEPATQGTLTIELDYEARYL